MKSTYHFNPYSNPPAELHLEITSECNLRCKQCHLWMSKEGQDSLSTNEKVDLIRQYYLMNPNGFVVLSGGEPMIKLDEFFTLTRLCRSVNLLVASTINGSCLTTETMHRLFTEGPQYISISLDSHVEEIHDYIRGKKGSYKHIINSIREMIELRSRKYSHTNTTITTNSILFDKNIHLWKDYIEFARTKLCVDAVSFQMLSRTFDNQGKGDYFFTNHFFRDTKIVHDTIDSVIKEYGSSPFLRTTVDDLEWMKLYVDNPDFIGEQVCGSHEKNLIVSQYGDVQLCYNMKTEVTKGRAIGNVRNLSLKELWIGDFAEEVRELMSECRMNCGMLNCHRKL